MDGAGVEGREDAVVADPVEENTVNDASASETVVNLRTRDGDRFVGESNEQRPHGEGTLHYHTGEMYEGIFVAGMKHGRGTYYFRNGGRYEGDWVEDLQHGFGIDYYANGDRYEGEWKNGNRHGKGVYVYRNDVRFEGLWVHGLASGGGVLLFSDGSRYEGRWERGVKHGCGTYIDATGVASRREYENGEILWKESLRNKHARNLVLLAEYGNELPVKLKLFVSSLEQLQAAIRSRFGISGEVQLTYLDKDFGRHVLLENISDLPDKVEVKVQELPTPSPSPSPPPTAVSTTPAEDAQSTGGANEGEEGKSVEPEENSPFPLERLPADFRDPITLEIMVDPVFTCDGHTYEREAITEWLAGHGTSPVTGKPLVIKTLTPNILLRRQILEWKERRKTLYRRGE